MVIGKAPGGGDLVVGAVRSLKFPIAAVVLSTPLRGNVPLISALRNRYQTYPRVGTLTPNIMNRGTEVQYHPRFLPKMRKLALATRNYQVWGRLRFRRLALAGPQHVSYLLHVGKPGLIL